MGIQISNDDFKTLLKEKIHDAEFQYQVGLCYYKGDGIDINNTEAMRWYKLAAEQGHAGAQFYLGLMFDYVEGVEKNLKEAVRFYELAAKQGHASAQNNLAVCYHNGEGVSQDYNEAIKLYMLSAAQGNWRASDNISWLYSENEGVACDFAKAKIYLEKALADADTGVDLATEEEKAEMEERLITIKNKLEEIESKAEAARKAARAEVFICYARNDKQYVNELRPHLEMLENTQNIVWWNDTKIKSGDEWETKINEALSKTKVAVLMTSANFFASDYIWRKELPELLEAADEDGATILWMPVSPCLLDDTGIARFQSVVTDIKTPLTARSENDRNQVYTDLARRIRDLFKAQ